MKAIPIKALNSLLLGLYFFSGWLAQAQQKPAETKEIAEYRAKAEKGDAAAQSALGSAYHFGKGVPKDDAEAVKWFRKAAEQEHARAQHNLGYMYDNGLGVLKDEVEAVKWFRRAADQGVDESQFILGNRYANGDGVVKDETEAVKWYRKAANQGYAEAQFGLGAMYGFGHGVAKDDAEAVKWYRKAAEQGHSWAQFNVAVSYYKGQGVPKDEIEAYKWWLLAGAQGNEGAKKNHAMSESYLTPSQRAEGQRLAREFKPRKASSADSTIPPEGIAQSRPESTGSGFFITNDGYFITNQHVAGEGAKVQILTASGMVSARVVKVDKANDLTLLKAEGRFSSLPVVSSRSVRLGTTAATVGFPNVGLQGFSPKLAKGEIASLSGAQDDARHFQISAPIQPGNSGGALVDERGNVIGVVVAKLNQKAALATSGTLAENVNYAVKSSFLLGFLEAVPEVAAKLKEPSTKDRRFEDVVKEIEQATVLILVY